jgi:hypothetical protein
MSFELSDATVADMRAEVWTITRLTFCGAAILFADRAAYTTTRISLAAAAAIAEAEADEESADITFAFRLLDVREED